MAKRWYVADTVRDRQDQAALSVVELQLEAYVPSIERYRRIGRRLVTVDAPRFGSYIFLYFDRANDPWPDLLHQRPFRQYFKRILTDVDGNPVAVPDKAMDVIMTYKPPKIEGQQPIVYQPGQRVCVLIGGMRKDAVFVEYCGTTPMIRTWIFGADRIMPVSVAELEPLEEVA